MNKHKLSVSLVIPVYNEEDHIKACLEAVARQTVVPDEVIVVDNNCTDRTIEIARSFPFVKIVRETRQGRGYARSKGFDAARSEVIGRIDADSKVLPDWVERVRTNFRDDTIAGLTGPGLTHTLPFRLIPNFYTTFWSKVYFWSTHADTRAMTMWGANMAIRRSVWRQVRAAVSLDDKLVHEDIDVSLVVIEAGGKIVQDNGLLIRTRGQDYHYFPKLVEYALRRIRTQRIHRRRGYLQDPKVHTVSFWRAEWWRFITFLPGLLFLLSSLLNWPLDALMVRTRRGMRWLR